RVSVAASVLLALRLGTRGHDLREHIRLAKDQKLVGADLDLGAAVLREDHLVALGDVERDHVAGLLRAVARADGEHATALRLLLGVVRQDYPAERRLLLVENLDDEPIAKRLQIHSTTSVRVFGLVALSPRECQQQSTATAAPAPGSHE